MLQSKKSLESMIKNLKLKEAFIEHLIEWKTIDKEDLNKPYNELVKSKCRYFASWCASHLIRNDIYLKRSIIIHEGLVEFKHHVWLEINGFYIDGTLTQFYPNYEGIVVLDRKEVEGPIYYSHKIYSFEEWLEKELVSEN